MHLKLKWFSNAKEPEIKKTWPKILEGLKYEAHTVLSFSVNFCSVLL